MKLSAKLARKLGLSKDGLRVRLPLSTSPVESVAPTTFLRGSRCEEVVLTLPWPPSLNKHWRNVNGRTLISAAGRQYRVNVMAAVIAAGAGHVVGRLAVEVEARPPDRRTRDLDNLLKGLLDAAGQAGLFADDSQIDDLRIRRGEVVEGGCICMRVRTLPA